MDQTQGAGQNQRFGRGIVLGGFRVALHAPHRAFWRATLPLSHLTHWHWDIKDLAGNPITRRYVIRIWKEMN